MIRIVLAIAAFWCLNAISYQVAAGTTRIDGTSPHPRPAAVTIGSYDVDKAFAIHRVADVPWIGPAQRPQAPVDLQGACPGECCGYGRWTAASDITLYAAPLSWHRPVGMIGEHSQFDAIDGFVRVDEIGVAEAVASFDRVVTTLAMKSMQMRVEPGSEFLVLDSMGEGIWRVWRDGIVDQMAIDAPQRAVERSRPTHQSRTDPVLAWKKQPKSQWWIKVALPRGHTGWFRADSSAPFSTGSCG